jgi:hypothetical protein
MIIASILLFFELFIFFGFNLKNATPGVSQLRYAIFKVQPSHVGKKVPIHLQKGIIVK